MVPAALAPIVESRRGGRFWAPLLVYVAGFGPLLCAVAMTWDKTEKTGWVSL